MISVDSSAETLCERRQALPSSDELPGSDDTPVGHEDQNFLPNYLLFLLELLWSDRQDWYFGVDMGIYHTTGASPRVPVVPAAFLSLGVPRRKAGNQSRKSYVVWEEGGIVPTLTLEIVSWTPGGEYDDKLMIYQQLGVRYYVVYNPEYGQRDGHQPFEIYKLVAGQYHLQSGEPYWMPEIGLALGRSQTRVGGIDREILSWFDAQGHRYLSAAEREQQAQHARLAAIARLHHLGLTAEQIATALDLPLEIVQDRLQ